MRAEAPLRSAFRHFAHHTTRWMDNDVYGHMNNVVHYSLFDSTVNTWLYENGVASPEVPSIGLVVQSGCDYFAELRYPEPVVAGLRTGHVGRSSVRYEIGLFGGEAEQAAAMGHFVHVYVDRVSRRPMPLPDVLRDALRQLDIGS